MWTDNYQRIDADYKKILNNDNDNLKNNGRINIFDNSEKITNDRIKLFERTEIKHKITDYRDALNSVLYNNKLSLMYFSAKNIQYIQNTLKNEIFKRSDGLYKLLPQNEDNLKIIMRFYFLQYVENDVGNENNEIKRINNILLNYLIPKLMNESEAYYKYIRDQSTLVMPFDRSIQVDRDWKELENEPFLFNWI
jgi:transcriptional/translational regulatory protein YebC/TACO1